MTCVKFLSICGAAAVGLMAMSGAASAAHGTVGLWDIEAHVTLEGSPKGPSTQTFSTQHCMTPQEVASDAAPKMADPNCQMTNNQSTATTFSGDLVCKGQMNSSGHISVTYDSATHYAGKMTMASMPGERPVHFTNTFEGHWVSADCGKVTQ